MLSRLVPRGRAGVLRRLDVVPRQRMSAAAGSEADGAGTARKDSGLDAEAARLLSSSAKHGGFVRQYEHDSLTTKTPMRFTIFYPGEAVTFDPERDISRPVLYYLSGLTCTDQNFTDKAGAQYWADKYGIILVAPDTSPRGAGIEGEDDAYDFGTGAGFYVDATQQPWSENYNMYSYVTEELPGVVKATLGKVMCDGRQSIFGHSMGGHGALICALKNPMKFASVSAFAPICNPSKCPWGEKAFGGYLGDNKDDWADYDATELVKDFVLDPSVTAPRSVSLVPKDMEYDTEGNPLNWVPPRDVSGELTWYTPRYLDILIDTGKADQFYKDGQLLPENFLAEAAKNEEVRVLSRFHEEFDHSYNFIASFMEHHMAFHAKRLGVAHVDYYDFT